MVKIKTEEKNKDSHHIEPKSITRILVIIIVLILGYIGYIKNVEYSQSNIGVAEDNPMLLYFQEKFPENEVLKAGLGDINDDGREDLVVIYRMTDEDANEMVVIFNEGTDYSISNSHRAPYENQTIEIMDIDDQPPNEFLISGSRNGNYGYAIYRVDDNQLVQSVFGENMTLC